MEAAGSIEPAAGGFLLQLLKPTVVLRGPAGEATIAPYGPAPSGGAVVLVAGVLLVLGGTFARGYTAGRAGG